MARPTETRSRIVCAAEEVVIRDGVAKLTLDAAAHEAGVSKGGVLYHFPTRAALVAAMVERFVVSFDADLARRGCAGGRPGDFVRAYIDATVSPSLEPGDPREQHLGAALLAGVASDPDLLEPLRARFASWQASIEADGIDQVVGTVIRLACDGMWLSDLFGLAPVAGRLRTEAGADLRRLVDRSAADASSLAPPATSAARSRPTGRLAPCQPVSRAPPPAGEGHPPHEAPAGKIMRMIARRRLAPADPVGDRRVRRVVAALSISAFAEWGGASVVLPLLPVYLRHEGSSVALVGLTMAAFFGAALIVQYPLGRLSDRIGRRQIQVVGLAVFAAASLLFAFATSPALALLFRALQGAGAGSVDVANAATIGDVVPASHRGRAFGTFYGARTVAMAVGPFFGGLVGISGMRWLFLASAACAAAAIAPIVLLIPKRAVHRPVPRSERTVLWRNRSIVGVMMAFIAGGLIIGVYEVCWSLLLAFRGATSWQIGLSWTLFALPFGIVSFPAGWLVDHFDRRYLIVMAMVGAAGFAATYPFVHSVAWLLGLGAAEAVLVAIGMPAEASQLAHSVPSHDLGRAQGAAATAQTAATGVAALVAGSLFGIHPWLPFAGASAVIVLCSASLRPLWRGVPGRNRPRAPAEPAEVVRAATAGGPPPL